MTKHEVPTHGTNAPQPVRTLRDWLDHLAGRDRLAVLKPNMALKFELAAHAKRLDGLRATVFPKPGGHPMPVVSGLVSDRGWIAEAMGVEPADMLPRFQEAASHPVPWQEVKSAPAQEVVHRSVDLTKLLPIPTHNEHDGGPYIAAGIMVVRNPKSGKQNVSIHRCQVTGPNRLGVLVLPRHTYTFHRMAEEAGRPLEAAIVIEGRFLPGVREPEGPFGEFPQTYGSRSNREVMEVVTVTHRKDAMFHTMSGGGLEHLLLGAIPKEATLLTHLRRNFPNVLDVHLSPGGTMRFHLFVKIKKIQEGQGKNIIMGAFAGSFDLKHVVVVDDDIDIHNPAEVELAIATRFQADRDLLVVPESQGSKLDPSNRDGVGAKMGLDATKPLAATEMHYKRIRVPGEETIDVAELLKRSGTDWRAALKD